MLHHPYARWLTLAGAALRPRTRDLLILGALWGLALAGGLMRPLLPIDETRYVSIAWEMWQHHQWWVMHMNGAPYSDKPPLLFWLIAGGWELMGVNIWWPKLISPLASLMACLHLYRIACQLGYSSDVARRAPIALLAMLLWNLYSGAVMFDILLTACLLGAIAPLIDGEIDGRKALTSGLWLGLALLAKGPVALLTYLIIVLSAPLWRAQPFARMGRRRIVMALGLGIAILLVWALPAAALGGHAYARMLLWGQSVDRLHNAMAHARPFWWYLPWLPVMLFPWSLWPAAWPRALPRQRRQRLAWIWALASLGLFSLISGKQLHYLMPALPAVALIVMDVFSATPTPRTDTAPAYSARLVALCFALLAIAGIAASLFMPQTLAGSFVSLPGAIVVLCVALLLFNWRWQHEQSAFASLTPITGLGVLLIAQLMCAPLWSHYNVRPAAQLLSELEQRGYPLAYYGTNYQATFQFAGRLHFPLAEVDDAPTTLDAWIASHPQGWFIGRERDMPAHIVCQPQAHHFAYRSGDLVIVPASSWQVPEARCPQPLQAQSAYEDTP